MSCKQLLLAALVALGACSNPPCIRHSDCNVGYICAEGTCIVPPDAAPEDDAGPEQIDAAPRPDAIPQPDADETVEEPDAGVGPDAG